MVVGPEHDVLAAGVGNWEVETRTWLGGGPPLAGKGRETCRPVMGGLGLTCDYASAGDKTPYFGHAFTTWNDQEKKYESYWMDSLSHGGLAHGWGTWDEAAKTLTEVLDGKNAHGKPFRIKRVSLFESADRRLQTFYEVLPDGQEIRVMELAYERRK
jgi:hypothetical protein